MNNDEFEGRMQALRAGKVTEDEFLRSTRDRWRAIALYLYGRWGRRLPAWVEVEDVQQVLMMESVRFVRSWQPGRGPRLATFVAWSAQNKAKKAMNKWRGALLSGNSGKNPSRFELPFSAVFPDGEESAGTRVPATAPEQEEAIESGRAFYSALDETHTVREALVLLALRASDGSMVRAAEALYEDFAARVECELTSERHARAVVQRMVSRLAHRAAA